MIQEEMEIMKNRSSCLGSWKTLWNMIVEVICVVMGVQGVLPKKEHIGNVGILSNMVVLKGSGIFYSARILLSFEESY